MPRRMMWILSAVSGLAPLSLDIYTPSFPQIQHDLAAPLWLVQLSVTACLLGFAVGQLVCGPLSDRFGRRPVLLAGTTGWTLTSAATALAPGIAAFDLLRAAAGVFGAAGIVVARAVVRDASGSSTVIGRRIAVLATASSLGPILAPPLGAAIAGGFGWRADFLALTLFGTALTIATAAGLTETATAAARASTARTALRAGLQERLLLLVALTLGLQSIGFYAYVATTSTVIERDLGGSATDFAVVFSTNAAAVLASNIVFRLLVHRSSPARLVAWGIGCSLLGGLGAAVLSAAGSPPGPLWAASIVFTAGIGLTLPGVHSWAQLTAVPGGTASAISGSAQFIGGALGSPVTGLIGPSALALSVLVTGSSAAAAAARALAARRTRHLVPDLRARP